MNAVEIEEAISNLAAASLDPATRDGKGDFSDYDGRRDYPLIAP
jgi:hypothetical protein